MYLNKQTNKPRTSRVGFPLFFISFHLHFLQAPFIDNGFSRGGERERGWGVLRFHMSVAGCRVDVASAHISHGSLPHPPPDVFFAPLDTLLLAVLSQDVFVHRKSRQRVLPLL